MGDRVILHSDINCCYASIEHLHHPELAGKPLVFFVKRFSLKKASEFPVFSKGFSLL